MPRRTSTTRTSRGQSGINPRDVRERLAVIETQLETLERERSLLLNLLPMLEGDLTTSAPAATTETMVAPTVSETQPRGSRRASLVTAAKAQRYSLRALAKAIGVSHVYLSQASHGQRSIREDVADKVHELVGYEKTRANWPKGWT